MKRLFILLTLTSVLLISCGDTKKEATGQAAQPADTPASKPPDTPEPTNTPKPEPTATATTTPTVTPTPTATLTSTPTLTPEPTNTPTPTAIPWRSYQMTNTVRIGDVSALWMPVPRVWDGVGMKNVEIGEISPPPDDLYEDTYGNLIAFWNVGYRGSADYSVAFSVDLAPIYHNIDLNLVQEYDTSSWEYQRFTQPSKNIQSANETVIQFAHDIVGEEANPYEQARLVHKWVSTKISYGGTAGDVISVLETNMSRDCYGVAVTFIGLLRSLGVPARLVGGYHNYRDGRFSDGLYEWPKEPFGIHVWAEFYVPGSGWLQVDPGDRNGFHKINEHRIVMFRGEDIELAPGYPRLEHFHMPHANYPPQQTSGESLMLMVESLP